MVQIMTPADALYTAVPQLVAALNIKAGRSDLPYVQRVNYRQRWDVCPIRGAWSDIARASEQVWYAMRDLGLEYANVTVDGIAYTVTLYGKISPSPIAMYAAKL